jgi:predicted DNA-binding transcriptional regulator YafY
MMMLQAKGRLSAETLAEELEVSVRTIYRDIDQLSASGVPVYAETGRNGGFQLLDGWRTRLTGLTPPEAQALFLSGLPGPASQLGLGEAMASAELKLLATLPPDWQIEAQRVSSRFHLDPSGWFQRAGATDWLKPVADAVWGEYRLQLSYDSWNGMVDRVVEPFGLVLKSGLWYLVARGESRSEGGLVMRTYRLDSIRK